MLKIDEMRCKGCALCVRACPLKLLEINKATINSKGYHPARITDESKCISCCACAITCPDICIEIQ